MRSAAFLLPHNMTISSAYLTNLIPLLSSNWSSSFNMMLASTGLITPPCGVPIVTFLLTFPSSLIGALRKRCIKDITLPSSILSDKS